MTADIEFDLTVREEQTLDEETRELKPWWQVESEHMPRPCGAETPAEALRILADCLEADPNKRVALSVKELAGNDFEEM